MSPRPSCRLQPLEPSLARRRLILAAAGALCSARPISGMAAAANVPIGRVEPRLPAPSAPLWVEDGRQAVLTELLRGRSTALQLMFTGCNSSCSLQGALFAAVAEPGLPANTQLLSISIDALGDNPATLRRWLVQFGRVPAWSAAVPRVDQVEPLSAWLKGGVGKPGTHTAQVFFFDSEAKKLADAQSNGMTIHAIGNGDRTVAHSVRAIQENRRMNNLPLLLAAGSPKFLQPFPVRRRKDYRFTFRGKWHKPFCHRNVLIG